MVNKFDYGELLAPRRQERQVQNRFSFAAFASLECQDKPGRSNILKGGYLVGCPFDK
jgi:hypothetical protein